MARHAWLAGIALLCSVSAFAAPASTSSNVCAACHPNVWRNYPRTGMARSFYRPKPENTVEDYRNNNTYYHQASDTYFAMIQRGGRYFQRQYQIGFDGQRTNIMENEIDFVLGSGNHARTYLHRTSKNTLIQLPLGWYAENGGYWAMNPGYDRPDHQGLRRRITYDCMFCHNAYPEVPSGVNDPRSAPIFSTVPEGIDCQRCHGNGEEHIALASTRGATPDGIRRAIVNPSRLTAERQMEVCMQCHLQTTSSGLPGSIVRYERQLFSYRPGEPLADFVLYFDHAPGKGYDQKFEITGSVYRLRQSQCFQKSGGALKCTTCHDPHASPRDGDAMRHYAAICRQCHRTSLESLIAAGKHSRSEDCVSCHMPKRRTDDVVHAVMTDHYIQRKARTSDLLAEIPERRQTEANAYRGQVVLYYPGSPPKAEDELYLAAAQVSESSNLTEGIQRLAAAIERYHPARAEYYLQLGDALCNAGKLTQALPVYEEARRREPESVAALERLAICLRNLKQYPLAEAALKQALARAPDAATWVQFGLVQLEQGRTQEAIAAFEKAIQIDPEMAEAYNSAGAVWLETGDSARAEAALRNAIRMQPNYAQAHNNLGNLLSGAGRFEEARYHFEAALRYKDDYVGARYNYALALTKARHLDEAQSQVEAILRIDPRSAEGHHFLGNLFAARGQFERAIAEYRESIQVEPEFARAILDLGAALVDSGDPAAALPFLRKAAQGKERATRDEALKLLQKLGKSP